MYRPILWYVKKRQPYTTFSIVICTIFILAIDETKEQNKVQQWLKLTSNDEIHSLTLYLVGDANVIHVATEENKKPGLMNSHPVFVIILITTCTTSSDGMVYNTSP